MRTRPKTPPSGPLAAPRAVEVMRHLRQGAAAWLLGLSVRRLRDVQPPAQPDGTWDAQALVRWHRERTQGPGAVPDEDALLSGPSSPALERFREERARREKRENDAAEGLLLDAGEVGNALAATARVLRERFAAIERVHGAQVGQELREAIDHAEREWTQIASPHAGDDGSEEVPSAEQVRDSRPGEPTGDAD